MRRKVETEAIKEARTNIAPARKCIELTAPLRPHLKIYFFNLKNFSKLDLKFFSKNLPV